MTGRLRVLSRYTRLGASSRLRTMQYLSWLEQAGWEVEYLPFFDDAYLQTLYGGGRELRSLIGYYRQRIADLGRGPKPDLLWVEYEALPWLPWAFERRLLPRHVPIVSDYDDAVFHRYDKHRRRTVRAFLGCKIDRIMASSALVTAGNPYLAARAAAAGARRIETVPTVVDLTNYRVAEAACPDGRPRVGWIGTPETWGSLASASFETLLPILQRHNAAFRAVGAELTPRADGFLDVIPWSEDAEVGLIQSMDVGVMPLPDTPWTRGKCGYKLIQYMACGLPVVASPVGVNAEIVEHGVNGFLVRSSTDWREAVDRLLTDPELRRRMGAAGRAKVERDYSLQVWGPRVAQMLTEAAGNRVA